MGPEEEPEPRRTSPQGDAARAAETHHGNMSTATLTPMQGGRPSGATATSDHRPRHSFGGVLRAAKVFATTAVSVVVLGEYAEDAGVIRR